MNKNEWYQIGEDIKKQVQQAIDSNDFSELSKNISETVGQAASDVGKSINEVSKGLNGIGKSLNEAMNDVAGSFQTGMNEAISGVHKKNTASYYSRPQKQQTTQPRQKWERYNGSVYYAKPNLRPDPKLFSGSPAGSVSGIVWIVAGCLAMGFGGFATVQHAVEIVLGAESVTALAIPLAATTTGVGLGVYGAGLKRRVDRFKHYVEIVKDKLYCSIEDIAGKTGRSKGFVRRDLKRMMRKGMFLQAHLDKKENCFIASDAMYEQYMLTQKQYEEKLRLENKTGTKEISEITADAMKNDGTQGIQIASKTGKVSDEKAVKVLEEGREYISFIRKCNDDIPGEEMSDKLDKLEMLVTRIFDRVEEEPEQAAELQKMLSYYLPTTQKLLEAYRDLDKQNLDVKNISATKREIETTVDTINRAFEGFLDDLFRDRAWDIQSDISVLNTMLKQDGYLKSDFEKGEK